MSRRLKIFSILLAWSLPLSAVLCAPTESESALLIQRLESIRAAFVLNFLKFTTFDSSPGREIPVCFYTQGSANVFRDAINGKAVSTETNVKVRIAPASTDECVVVYDQRGGPVSGPAGALRIADGRDPCERKSHISLFEEEGKMRFAVDRGLLQRDGIQLSSKVLALARVVECH